MFYKKQLEKKFKYSTLVIFHTPVDAADEAYKIITLEKNVEDFDFTSAYTLTNALNAYEQNLVTPYSNSIVYIAVATKNASAQLVQYSATYSKEN